MHHHAWTFTNKATKANSNFTIIKMLRLFSRKVGKPFMPFASDFKIPTEGITPEQASQVEEFKAKLAKFDKAYIMKNQAEGKGLKQLLTEAFGEKSVNGFEDFIIKGTEAAELRKAKEGRPVEQEQVKANVKKRRSS